MDRRGHAHSAFSTGTQSVIPSKNGVARKKVTKRYALTSHVWPLQHIPAFYSSATCSHLLVEIGHVSIITQPGHFQECDHTCAPG